MIERISCKDCFFFSIVEGTLKEDCQYSINDLKKAGFKRRQVSDYEDGHGLCHRYPPVLKPHEDYLHYEFHNEISNNFVFVSFEDWCGEAIRETKKKNLYKQLISNTSPEILKDFELNGFLLKDKVKGKLDPKVLKVKVKDLKLGWGLVRRISYQKKKLQIESVENRWVDTIEDILEFSEIEILKWKGFGSKKLEWIKSALNQEGICFIEG